MRFFEFGFTLVECLLGLTLVAVLFLIAVPIYESQIIKSQRLKASSTLLILATKLEEYYFHQGTYALNNAYNSSEIFDKNSYQLHMTLDEHTYQICAQPINRQVRDHDCGTLCYNEKGQKTITGNKTTVYCWP